MGSKTPHRVIVQVKSSGAPKPAEIRELRGTLEREHAALAVFITLNPPTSEMTIEAVAAGKYIASDGTEFNKLQILTIEDLLKGDDIAMPRTTRGVLQSPVHKDASGGSAQIDLL
jgi:hypothetical protein